MLAFVLVNSLVQVFALDSHQLGQHSRSGEVSSGNDAGQSWYMTVHDAVDPYCFDHEDESGKNILCSSMTSQLQFLSFDRQEVHAPETSEPTLWIIGQPLQLAPTQPASYVRLHTDTYARPSHVEFGCIDDDSIHLNEKKVYNVMNTSNGWTELLELPICTGTYDSAASLAQEPSPAWNSSEGRCDRNKGIGIGNVDCTVGTRGPCCSAWGWCGDTDNHCKLGKNGERVDWTNHTGHCDNSLFDPGCPTGTCCSEWGWCGPGEDFCGGASPAHSNGTVSTEPPPAIGDPPPIGYTGMCRTKSDCQPNDCCSQAGYCGSGPDYCGNEHHSPNAVNHKFPPWISCLKRKVTVDVWPEPGNIDSFDDDFWAKDGNDPTPKITKKGAETYPQFKDFVLWKVIYAVIEPFRCKNGPITCFSNQNKRPEECSGYKATGRYDGFEHDQVAPCKKGTACYNRNHRQVTKNTLKIHFTQQAPYGECPITTVLIPPNASQILVDVRPGKYDPLILNAAGRPLAGHDKVTEEFDIGPLAPVDKFDETPPVAHTICWQWIAQGHTTRPTLPAEYLAGQDRWCNLNCNHVPSYCPPTHCESATCPDDLRVSPVFQQPSEGLPRITAKGGETYPQLKNYIGYQVAYTMLEPGTCENVKLVTCYPEQSHWESGCTVNTNAKDQISPCPVRNDEGQEPTCYDPGKPCVTKDRLAFHLKQQAPWTNCEVTLMLTDELLSPFKPFCNRITNTGSFRVSGLNPIRSDNGLFTNNLDPKGFVDWGVYATVDGHTWTQWRQSDTSNLYKWDRNSRDEHNKPLVVTGCDVVKIFVSSKINPQVHGHEVFLMIPYNTIKSAGGDALFEEVGNTLRLSPTGAANIDLKIYQQQDSIHGAMDFLDYDPQAFDPVVHIPDYFDYDIHNVIWLRELCPGTHDGAAARNEAKDVRGSKPRILSEIGDMEAGWYGHSTGTTPGTASGQCDMVLQMTQHHDQYPVPDCVGLYGEEQDPACYNDFLKYTSHDSNIDTKGDNLFLAYTYHLTEDGYTVDTWPNNPAIRMDAAASMVTREPLGETLTDIIVSYDSISNPEGMFEDEGGKLRLSAEGSQAMTARLYENNNPVFLQDYLAFDIETLLWYTDLCRGVANGAAVRNEHIDLRSDGANVLLDEVTKMKMGWNDGASGECDAVLRMKGSAIGTVGPDSSRQPGIWFGCCSSEDFTCDSSIFTGSPNFCPKPWNVRQEISPADNHPSVECADTHCNEVGAVVFYGADPKQAGLLDHGYGDSLLTWEERHLGIGYGHNVQQDILTIPSTCKVDPLTINNIASGQVNLANAQSVDGSQCCTDSICDHALRNVFQNRWHHPRYQDLNTSDTDTINAWLALGIHEANWNTEQCYLPHDSEIIIAGIQNPAQAVSVAIGKIFGQAPMASLMCCEYCINKIRAGGPHACGGQEAYREHCCESGDSLCWHRTASNEAWCKAPQGEEQCAGKHPWPATPGATPNPGPSNSVPAPEPGPQVLNPTPGLPPIPAIPGEQFPNPVPGLPPVPGIPVPTPGLPPPVPAPDDRYTGPGAVPIPTPSNDIPGPEPVPTGPSPRPIPIPPHSWAPDNPRNPSPVPNVKLPAGCEISPAEVTAGNQINFDIITSMTAADSTACCNANFCEMALKGVFEKRWHHQNYQEFVETDANLAGAWEALGIQEHNWNLDICSNPSAATGMAKSAVDTIFGSNFVDPGTNIMSFVCCEFCISLLRTNTTYACEGNYAAHCCAENPECTPRVCSSCVVLFAVWKSLCWKYSNQSWCKCPPNAGADEECSVPPISEFVSVNETNQTLILAAEEERKSISLTEIMIIVVAVLAGILLMFCVAWAVVWVRTPSEEEDQEGGETNEDGIAHDEAQPEDAPGGNDQSPNNGSGGEPGSGAGTAPPSRGSSRRVNPQRRAPNRAP